MTIKLTKQLLEKLINKEINELFSKQQIQVLAEKAKEPMSPAEAAEISAAMMQKAMSAFAGERAEPIQSREFFDSRGKPWSRKDVVERLKMELNRLGLRYKRRWWKQPGVPRSLRKAFRQWYKAVRARTRARRQSKVRAPKAASEFNRLRTPKTDEEYVYRSSKVGEKAHRAKITGLKSTAAINKAALKQKNYIQILYNQIKTSTDSTVVQNAKSELQRLAGTNPLAAQMIKKT